MLNLFIPFLLSPWIAKSFTYTFRSRSSCPWSPSSMESSLSSIPHSSPIIPFSFRKKNQSRASCSDNFTDFLDLPFMKPNCKSKPAYKKLVFFVEDGIRSDLLYGNKTYSHSNYTPCFNKILDLFPHNSFCVDLYANTPTTTYEGVKSMTTGTTNSLIELSNSFGDSHTLGIDNWIEQIADQQRYLLIHWFSLN